MTNSLPKPESAALAHSQQLMAHISAEIAQKGAIDFARFMELALYAPGLGYYTAGATKFGQQGDFITAPELSPLFAKCIAAQIQQVFIELKQADILEIGAGTGILAVEILIALEQLNALPQHYYILELSADLRQRQQKLIQQKIPQFFPNIIWLDKLPAQPITGVILANEVLDAMPVHKFNYQADIQEYFINYKNEQLVWELKSASEPVKKAIKKLAIEFSENYTSEINLVLPAWIASLNQILKRGLILLIDYGFSRQEYYHADRSMGTIMCHYRHYAHDDPLLWPGLQDITAHVDFTAVAEAAVDNGLTVAGYTTQANFLLGCGIDKIAQLNIENTTQQWQVSQQLKRLMLPSEMGELFKAIALTKALALSLIGFQFDMRERL